MSEHGNAGLRWQRVDGTHHLKVMNATDEVGVGLGRLLEAVERDASDFRKPFSRDASEYFREWLRDPRRNLLREEAYCLLSNWFLTSSPAHKSARAQHARTLWDALFRTAPRRRLTNPKNNRRAIEREFREWWDRECMM